MWTGNRDLSKDTENHRLRTPWSLVQTEERRSEPAQRMGGRVPLQTRMSQKWARDPVWWEGCGDAGFCSLLVCIPSWMAGRQK